MCTTSVVGNDGKTRCKRTCCRAEEECLVEAYVEGGVNKTGPKCGAACRTGTTFCDRSGGNLLCCEPTEQCVPNPSGTGMTCSSADDNVVAVPGGPYTTGRGQRVMLDGSRSKGKIDKWTWTLSPGDGCPGGVRTKTVPGAVASVTVLCSLQAKLRVENSRKSDEKTTTVTVKPRLWKTEFPATNSVSTWNSANPLHWGCTFGGCELGRNVCGPHDSEDTHDIVHQMNPDL